MRKPTDVFGEWAEIGKDIGMEESHAIAVDEMISFPLNKNNLSDFKNTRIIFQKSIVSKKKLKKGHMLMI